MADWFEEEYEGILGLKHIKNSDYDPSIPERQEDGLKPIDWRDASKNPKGKVAVTPVKDRTNWRDPGGHNETCAASYAVAVAEFLEGRQALRNKKLATVSV